MREIKFRACNGFSRYEIGTDGSVYSTNYNHTGKRKEMSQYLDKEGYLYVFFVVDNKRHKKMIHRLVAESFISKVDGKLQVNHKNGVRNDNRIENLEWVTSQENTIHGFRSNGRKHTEIQISVAKAKFSGVNNPKAKLTFQQVSEIKRLRNECGHSLLEMSQMFKISKSQISSIANGRCWNEKIQSMG